MFAAACGDDDGGPALGSDTTQPAAAGGGSGTATVSLANGESFEFSILCALEPQTSAGSEILFTVVSYDDPVSLDVTQFGEDDFGGSATITLYDSSTYETIWEAGSMFGTGDLQLELQGSTVTGSGTFYPEGDVTADGVQGELVANCS